MKSILRKIKPLHKIFWLLEPKFRMLLGEISQSLQSRYLYWFVYGRNPNFKNPKYFTEKLNYLKLNWKSHLLAKCTDKYEVREYVNERVGDEILNDLLFVYDSVDDIDFDKLPHQFALKCTHGCGCNIIVRDKSLLDIKSAKSDLSKWMSTDYSKSLGESHYRDIKPRIVCEKFLGGEGFDFAVDYKIWCFNGEPKFVQICTDRENILKYTYRDFEWNLIDIAKDCFPRDIDQVKPESLNVMIESARKLSEGIPFVRVDFYDFNGNAIFGELTFTPAGGFAHDYSLQGDEFLGNLLDIDNIIKHL